jgi:hypothetical protein
MDRNMWSQTPRISGNIWSLLPPYVDRPYTAKPTGFYPEERPTQASFRMDIRYLSNPYRGSRRALPSAPSPQRERVSAYTVQDRGQGQSGRTDRAFPPATTVCRYGPPHQIRPPGVSINRYIGYRTPTPLRLGVKYRRKIGIFITGRGSAPLCIETRDEHWYSTRVEITPSRVLRLLSCLEPRYMRGLCGSFAQLLAEDPTTIADLGVILRLRANKNLPPSPRCFSTAGWRSLRHSRSVFDCIGIPTQHPSELMFRLGLRGRIYERLIRILEQILDWYIERRVR